MRRRDTKGEKERKKEKQSSQYLYVLFFYESIFTFDHSDRVKWLKQININIMKIEMAKNTLKNNKYYSSFSII